MRIIYHYISVFLTMAMVLIAFASCGLVDFDFGESLPGRYDMHLNKDTVYIMEGDSFSLYPIYTPEISEGNVFWTSNDSILEFRNNIFHAKRTGETDVTAFSPIQSLKASCYVNVMPKWETPIYDYPDETIIYARVLYDGKFINPKKIKVAAFIDDECRGVGELKDFYGSSVIQFRVCGDLSVDEYIRFRIYYLDKLLCDYFPQKIVFDGNTHGMVSSLLLLSYVDE